MRSLKIMFAFLVLTLFGSCDNTSKTGSDSVDNSAEADTLEMPEQSAETVDIEEGEAGSITTLNFKDFSVSIDHLLVSEGEKVRANDQVDTVRISAELGETIEGQLITVSTDLLEEIKIEQRYETSMTIMNEGAHCDLTDWKHYDSNWKSLPMNKSGKYECAKYAPKDYEKFPKVSEVELKQYVLDHCGEEWFEQVKKIKKQTDYPVGVSVSRYFLKITGIRKDNGKTVQKIIVVEVPMGC
jgi:hypothetical protein